LIFFSLIDVRDRVIGISTDRKAVIDPCLCSSWVIRVACDGLVCSL